MGFLNKSKPYTEYFDHDLSVISETGYKNKGVKNGPYVKYGYQDKDKYLLEEGTYKDGEKHGDVKVYSETGQIVLDGYMKNDKRNGKSTYFYDNGQVKIEGNYKDGNKDGKWTDYRKNGQKWREEIWIDGKEDGKWTFYDEDGNIDYVEEYKNGGLVY